MAASVFLRVLAGGRELPTAGIPVGERSNSTSSGAFDRPAPKRAAKILLILEGTRDIAERGENITLWRACRANVVCKNFFIGSWYFFTDSTSLSA